jgi:hypothetical protein
MTVSPWPLPLTAFEEYMIRDDRSAYPMCIIARLQFAGRLDTQAAEVAWRQAFSRHPLPGATVRINRKRRPEWTSAQSVPALRWTSRDLREILPDMGPLDVTQEPGLRGWASSDADHSTIVVQVHHAACDGKGVLQLADDFLRGYALVMKGERCGVELATYDEGLLPRRGTYGLTARKLLAMLPAQLSGLIGAGQFLFRQPVPLLASGESSCRDSKNASRHAECDEYNPPSVRTGRIEADVLRRLSAAAKEQQVTVNDWLLRDFFLAVDDFRRRHESPRETDWLRFSVPINLRQQEDARLSAANVVSMVFLDRNARQIADPASLLRGIHDEMDLIRRRQLGLTFIWSLHALRALPGGLAGRVGNGRCEATCVVSNLGRALADCPLPARGGKLVAGNLLLEGIEFFGPVREGTAAIVAFVFYAGELQICVRYDSGRITAGQADDLLTTYLQTIRATVGMAPPVRCNEAA